MHTRNQLFDDVLETIFSSYQLRAEVIVDTTYRGDWYEREPASRRGQFHLIGEGECTIGGPEMKTPILLRSGDLAVLPFGTPHTLAPVPADSALESGPPSFTSILCGHFEILNGTLNPILKSLPQCLVARSADTDAFFRSAAQLLNSAARAERVGNRTVINKLTDTMLTLAICDHLQRSQELCGIFSALADDRLTRALQAIHCRTGENWNIHSLARLAGMSRSVFALRFSEAIGVPPMQYLTSWRILRAKQLLQDRRLSVATIAQMLGYNSETAFRKVFKRIVGRGPGEVRSSREAEASSIRSDKGIF